MLTAFVKGTARENALKIDQSNMRAEKHDDKGQTAGPATTEAEPVMAGQTSESTAIRKNSVDKDQAAGSAKTADEYTSKPYSSDEITALEKAVEEAVRIVNDAKRALDEARKTGDSTQTAKETTTADPSTIATEPVDEDQTADLSTTSEKPAKKREYTYRYAALTNGAVVPWIDKSDMTDEELDSYSDGMHKCTDLLNLHI